MNNLVPEQVNGVVSQQQKTVHLSPRELRVLQLIATGMENKEIANTIFLSVHTIEFHAKSIYRKLSVKTRTQAVYQAQLIGLLSGPSAIQLN